MSDGQQLTIRLNQSRVARSFPIGQTLWKPELKRILAMLADHQDALGSGGGASGAPGPRSNAPFLSIAIFGPSGSGKSSLLRTLRRTVNDEDQTSYQEIVDSAHRVEGVIGNGEEEVKRVVGLAGSVWALEVLQPDKFEKSHDFLYAFLATALNEERERRTRGKRGGEGGREREDRRYRPDALSPVQQSFQEMSEFLRVFNPASQGDAALDPLGVSLEQLESHSSGVLLHRKMAEFIDELTDAVTGSRDPKKPSLLLLPVDDADLATQHLVRVLQIFQSYLLHPRLVPVFTFTDRMGEEILRHHFETQVGASDRRTLSEAGETRIQLPIQDHLSLQYLSRSFPVRNRIRLGPAPARLRGSEYVRRSDGSSKKKVEDLLRKAALLLFGAPDEQARHNLYASVRSSTLRRQLHVLDEMVGAGVERYLGEDAAGDEPKRRWVHVYNRAAWALMNVHRDVLREYDLHLEELHSWTPGSLRMFVLTTLLQHPRSVRSRLLQRWRYRVDSRRAQALSLLAANIFRPWMPGEEPPGDELYVPRVEDLDSTKLAEGEERLYEEGDGRLYAGTAFTWFMQVTLGFYLPQVLAWERPRDQKGDEHEHDVDVGVGWNFKNGSALAIRSALDYDSTATLGMMFLAFGEKPKKDEKPKNDEKTTEERFLEVLRGGGKDADQSFLLRCWLNVGFDHNRYWLAVSFWHGLSLMARLLEARRQDAWKRASKGNPEGDEEWLKVGRRILKHHMIRGMVPGSLLRASEDSNLATYAFPGWENTHAAADSKLAGDLLRWASDSIPQANSGQQLVDLQIRVGDPDWKASVVRRMHGRDVVGDLLPRLNAAYLQEQDGKRKGTGDEPHLWSADIALRAWTRVLLNYWAAGKSASPGSVVALLEECPILKPFIGKPDVDTDVFQDLTRRVRTSPPPPSGQRTS